MDERDDTDLLRKMIIDMPYVEWKKMGFSKGTLHYMKQNATRDKPFSLNTHVRERLETWQNIPSPRRRLTLSPATMR